MSHQSEAGYLGPELDVRGDLRGEADVRIDGRFQGDYSVDGRLEVGESGRVQAPTRTKELSVEGAMTGDVRADEVCILETGTVEGDVTTKRLSVVDGGSLKGMIYMDFDLPEELVRL
ncbi:MAG: polymer-forming cytoskeletal protein [Myxococcota bacterium]